MAPWACASKRQASPILPGAGIVARDSLIVSANIEVGCPSAVDGKLLDLGRLMHGLPLGGQKHFLPTLDVVIRRGGLSVWRADRHSRIVFIILDRFQAVLLVT